jgi:transcriptional regulator with XRE-family HTH domain
MTSLQITISPKDRVAGRFVERVRRSIQKALAEEKRKNGTTQSDLARAIGVNRSVVSREVRGHKDLTLSRVAELAWALGRTPSFELPERTLAAGTNAELEASGVETNGTFEVEPAPPPETGITVAQAA